MSFLLQTRRRGVSSRKAVGNNSRNESSTNLNSNGPTLVSSNRHKHNKHLPVFRKDKKATVCSGDGQVLLQKQSDPTPKQSQQQSQQKQEDGVISMDEVMDDLRVLEQQQRDSQRSLASIKLTKQHKLEQRSSLEEKISSLKYLNGERRAQLSRARDVLSKSTREIGTARLRSGKAGENLKNFDQKLKRAVSTVRVLQEKRRQVDALTIEMRNTNLVISKKKGEAEEHFQGLKMKCEESKHREDLLLRAIQSAKIKMQSLIDETFQMRTEISGLEQDLAISQQMEASTKLRAEGIKNEIKQEKKRCQNSKAAYEEKMTGLKNKNTIINKKIHEVSEAIESKKEELLNAWRKLNEYEEAEGFAVSPRPTDESPPLVLDISNIRIKVESEEKAVQDLITEVGLKRTNFEKLSNELHDISSNIVDTDKERESTHAFISENKILEDERERYRNEVVNDIQIETEEVHKLLNSLNELTRKEEEDISNSSNETSRILKQLSSLQHEVSNIATETSIQRDLLEEVKKQVDRTKVEKESSISDAKREADEIKTKFDKLTKHAETLSSIPEFDSDEEIKAISQDRDANIEKINAEINHILEKYQFLSNLNTDYDPVAPQDIQKTHLLSGLMSTCDEKINNAVKTRKARLMIAKEEKERERLKQEAIAKKIEEAERIRKEQIEREAAEAEKLRQLNLIKEAEERERRHLEKKRMEAEEDRKKREDEIRRKQKEEKAKKDFEAKRQQSIVRQRDLELRLKAETKAKEREASRIVEEEKKKQRENLELALQKEKEEAQHQRQLYSQRQRELELRKKAKIEATERELKRNEEKERKLLILELEEKQRKLVQETEFENERLKSIETKRKLAEAKRVEEEKKFEEEERIHQERLKARDDARKRRMEEEEAAEEELIKNEERERQKRKRARKEAKNKRNSQEKIKDHNKKELVAHNGGKFEDVKEQKKPEEFEQMNFKADTNELLFNEDSAVFENKVESPRCEKNSSSLKYTSRHNSDPVSKNRVRNSYGKKAVEHKHSAARYKHPSNRQDEKDAYRRNRAINSKTTESTISRTESSLQVDSEVVGKSKYKPRANEINSNSIINDAFSHNPDDATSSKGRRLTTQKIENDQFENKNSKGKDTYKSDSKSFPDFEHYSKPSRFIASKSQPKDNEQETVTFAATVHTKPPSFARGHKSTKKGINAVTVKALSKKRIEESKIISKNSKSIRETKTLDLFKSTVSSDHATERSARNTTDKEKLKSRRSSTKTSKRTIVDATKTKPTSRRRKKSSTGGSIASKTANRSQNFSLMDGKDYDFSFM